MRRSFTFRSRVQTAAALLDGRSGRLLDVGARSKGLGALVESSRLSYFSADVAPGHDFQVDLEKPLPFEDASFDHVVALDVLEHVEKIHAAFRELSRVCRETFLLSLPNMASLPRRLSFLASGSLRTGKYDLLPYHQGDRHRWLTVYAQINRFVTENAAACGMRVERMVEETDGNLPLRLTGWALGTARLPLRGWMTGRCLYLLSRRGEAGTRRDPRVG